MRKHNPNVDWIEGSLRLDRCPATCEDRRRHSRPEVPSADDTGVRPTVRMRSRKARMSSKGKVHSRVDDAGDDEFTPLAYPTSWDGRKDSLVASTSSRRAKGISNGRLHVLPGFSRSRRDEETLASSQGDGTGDATEPRPATETATQLHEARPWYYGTPTRLLSGARSCPKQPTTMTS